MDVGELSVGVRADIRELTVGLQRGIAEIKQFQTQAQGYIQSHGQEWARMGRQVALALAGVAYAVNRMTQDAARYGEEILKVSRITGLTVEETQKLRYAVEQSEGDFNITTRTIIRLTQSAMKAVEGNKEMVASFNDLGIEFQDVNGHVRNGADLLMDLSDQYVNGKISGEDLADTLELIGIRGAINVLPFLSVGRVRIQELFKESEKFGNLTKEQINILDTWGDSMKKMQKESMGVKTAIVEALLPMLPALQRSILRISEGWEGFNIIIADSMKWIWTFMEGVDRLGAMAAKLSFTGTFLGIKEEGWTKAADAYEKYQEDMTKEIREREKNIKSIYEQIAAIKDFDAATLVGENSVAKALDKQTEEIRKSKEDLVSEMLGVFEWKPAALLGGGGAEFGMKGGRGTGEKGATVLNLSITVQSRSELHNQLNIELDKLGTVN